MLYKHKDNEDVAFEVLKKFYVKEKQQWKMTVRWWNIGKVHAPWCMGINQKITLSLEVWCKDWQYYWWRPIDRTNVKQILRGLK